jgi:hypothetical protein
MSRAIFVFNETSPAAPGTAASSQGVQSAGSFLPAGVAGPMQDYEAVDVLAQLRGATGGTLDVYIQSSPDDGQTWFDLVHFPQLAAGAGQVIYKSPISNTTTTSAPVVVGMNLSPALAVNTVVNGAFSDRMRLVMVAGSGTSVGANVIVRVAPQRGEPLR